MAVAVEEFLSGVDTEAVTLTTDASTEAGWWLLAVHGWSNAASPLTAPPSGAGWQLLTVTDASNGEPQIRVWATQVTETGAQVVEFPTFPTLEVGNHARLWVLSGARRFMAYGTAVAADSGVTHTAPSAYSLDDDGLLICSWLASGAEGNYTLPVGMTGQAETDDAGFSTGASATLVLSAHGPTSDKIATFSEAGMYWAAVSIAVAPMGVVTFPATPLGFRVELGLGVDLASNPGGWGWEDITEFVDFSEPIRITAGGANGAARPGPSTGTLKLKNGDRRFSRRNPEGPYYGLLTKNTPIQILVNPGSGWELRAGNFVPSWSPERGLIPDARRVPIKSQGVSYRLTQGSSAAASLLRLDNLAGSALEYWTLEDGAGSNLAASAVGGIPMSVQGDVDFAADSSVLGSGPLPIIRVTGRLLGTVPEATSSFWRMPFVVRVPAPPAAPVVLAEWTTTGTLTVWQIVCDPVGTSLKVRGYTGDGALVVDGEAGGDWSVPGTPTWGDAVQVVLSLTQDGADVDWRFSVGSSDSGTVSGQTIGRVAALKVAPHADVEDVTVGHFLVQTQEVAGNPALELDGRDGERAVVRLARVCAAAGIPLSLEGVPADTARNGPPMGPQETGPPTTILRDCERADQGLLFDYGFGFRYQSRASRYNAVPALHLDYLTEMFDVQPVDDVVLFRNDRTSSRPDGSSARAFDAESIAEHGQYDDESSVRVQSDDQLPGDASWRLHLGLVDELRIPRMTLHLARTPQVILSWASAGVGARLVATNRPDDIDDDIDQFVEGYTEVLGRRTWDVVANCGPARPFEVFEIGHPRLGRIDAAGSTLAVDIDEVGTAWLVSTIGLPWVTGAPYLPMDIGIGGEQMTVTAVAGASSPQTFTVTRSVNGVVKAHFAGAQVHIWNGGVVAL